MSWIRIWIHLVFTTKNSQKLLTKEIRQTIFDHIKDNAVKKGIKLINIGGYLEHIHCLILLNKDQAISESARLIKGESSHWINKNKIVKGKFNWQDDYWAVSVSESHVKTISKYIDQQEEHHHKKSFTEEIDEFMVKYGWKYIK